MKDVQLQYCIVEKVLVISIFVGKIKLNFQYKKITEKMYYNLLEKYNNSVFLILKICEAGCAVAWK